MRHPDLSGYESARAEPKRPSPPPAPSPRNPYLRAILPAPLASNADVLKQFYLEGIPQFRFLQK